MTPFLKFVKKKTEQWFGTWYEGPEPPERLARMVMVFANANPRATRAEWIQFATDHAGESYKSGYLRGFEYTERDPDWRPDIPPEQFARMIDPDWEWSDPVQLEHPPDELVQFSYPEDEVLRHQIDEANRLGAKR